MSLEALWTVTFGTMEGPNQIRIGAGIVVFETGRIFGGDNKYYYIGNYKYDDSNNVIQGNVEVINYTGDKYSIFGELDRFNLKINGNLEIPQMTLSGNMVEDPSKLITIYCVRKEELP